VRSPPDVPDALDQVSLPVSKYLRTDPLAQLTAPPGPAAEVKLSNQMGPFGLYLLLSTGLRATDALTASDVWGNDRYTAYLLDGQVCVDVHLVADSRDDADRQQQALEAWAAARPAATHALLGRDGVNLYASACDPGAETSQPVPTTDAFDHYLARAQQVQLRSDYSGNPALAECVAVTFFATNSVTDPRLDYSSEMDRIEQSCLDTV